jgi:hypothetical protein
MTHTKVFALKQRAKLVGQTSHCEMSDLHPSRDGPAYPHPFIPWKKRSIVKTVVTSINLHNCPEYGVSYEMAMIFGFTVNRIKGPDPEKKPEDLLHGLFFNFSLSRMIRVLSRRTLK